MSVITPCLWFESEAEDAAALYTGVVRNSRILAVARSGVEEDAPAVSVSFELDGQPFLALNGARAVPFTDAVSFQIGCSGQDEVDHYWDSLTAGGGQAGRCGWLKDRYGVSWQVVPTALPSLIGGEDTAGAQRALSAMLTMGKLDIGVLERAYSGE
ncbi:putative 3-demethylubiquinone-9 3-methyltransferase (glyoxalase superfamily) [Arthrobacter sp. CAN_A6]|uniref:VOC family protein n=1 Tax=Arthrobacter sp. CAN_A6 TaxID=2787721 RepID=UPI0018CA8F0E